MAAISGVPISGDHDVFISVDVDFSGRAIDNSQLLVALTVTGTGFSFSGGLIGGRYLAGSTTTQERKNNFAFLASPKNNAPAITSPGLHDFGQPTPTNSFVGKVGLIWRRDGTLEYNPYEEAEPTLSLNMGTPMAAGTYTFGLTVWGDGGADMIPFMSPDLTNFTIQELEGEEPEGPGPAFWTGYVNCTET